MKQKITQWAEQVTTSARYAWGTLAIVIAVPALTTLIIGLVSPATSTGVAFGEFAMVIVFAFLGSVMMAGLVSWASVILGFEKKGFIRALGITAFSSLLVLPFSIITTVFMALLVMSPTIIAPFLVLFYIAMIIVGVIVSLFLISLGYGITRGQAFGLMSTAYGLFFMILISIFATIALVLSFFLPGKIVEQQNQYDAMMESNTMNMNPESLGELETLLEGIQEASEGVAEETEL